MEQIGPKSHLERMEGDGMETKPKRVPLFDTLIYRQLEKPSYTRADIPTGRIVHLVPKYVPNASKPVTFLTKPKDPKFVPYEPYKAATKPIIPRRRKLQKSRNNVDIHDLVAQMSQMAAAELCLVKEGAAQSQDPIFTRKQWENEKLKFDTDIKNLRETNTHLENQLKFQAQVNSELKTLLVAAVGEDLESRVQHLTEDKLALARELLNSANHLTSHREHTEWLSGQCEVWRSKFLASSLMVEELARWKSALTNKIGEFKDVLKHLLEERANVRNLSLKTYSNLNLYHNHHFTTNVHLKSKNLLDLALTNQQLSSNLVQTLFPNEEYTRKVSVAANEDVYTSAEKMALAAVRSSVTVLEKPDIACNAVMGAALAVGRGQLFLQHPADHATCCAHCKGEIKDI